MSKSVNIITTIYNARNNVLEIMDTNGFDITNYANISINELIALIKNPAQLDIILQSKQDISPQRKIYIKFYLDGTVNSSIIETHIDELFEITGELNKATDVLYFIATNEVNESLTKVLQNIWTNKNILVVVEHIKQLQFNIYKHEMVPQHIKMSQEDIKKLNEKYDINKIPLISRFDPVARALCLKPGDVVKILRPSPTAIINAYYRMCVNL